jgi:D-alanyl-D-alanine carboxypeptidase/D-alanyl-D-alanine-endopeptidase (penicillin-binding protein 4)
MLRLRRDWAVVWLLLLAVPLPARADTEKDLAARIDAVINGPDYKQATWGILVVDARTGKTVYGLNPEKLFVPASTTKLFSTPTALAALGPAHRFETPVYARGKIDKGTLKGDLILVASGDPTLGGRTDADGRMRFKDHDHIYANSSLGRAELTGTDPLAGLNDLAKQVAAAGIRQVDGEVLIDDRLFAKSRGTGSGPDLLTPIVVNDNVVDVVITPGAKAGEPATVRLHPENNFVKMDAQVKTVARGGTTRLGVVPVGLQRFAVRGEIRVGARPAVRIYSVDDPAGWARALFIEALRRAGVAVMASELQPPQAELPPQDGYNRRGGVTPPLQKVARFTSPPFSEVVKVTLKVSHNLYASLFPLLVAVKQGKTTLEEGMRLQRKFLADLGVDVETICFGGGAGGSPADCVTPRAAVQLLQALARRSDYKFMQAGLPVLGVDGTLADAVPSDSPAKGKVLAKTGTYYWYDAMNDRGLLTSKALAGTMTSAGGRPLIVAIFVNKVPLPKGVLPTREGKVIGRLCEVIYQHTP